MGSRTVLDLGDGSRTKNCGLGLEEVWLWPRRPLALVSALYMLSSSPSLENSSRHCQPGELADRGADVPVLFRRGWRTKWVCHTESHAKYPGTRCNAAARTLPLGTSVSESDSSTACIMPGTQSHTDQITKLCNFWQARLDKGSIINKTSVVCANYKLVTNSSALRSQTLKRNV